MPTEPQHTVSIETSIPSDFNEQLHLLLTLPTIKPTKTSKNRIPITLFISNTAQNAPFSSYTYTIPDPVRDEIYQTILNNSGEDILECNKKIARIICKKFSCPVYLGLNCEIDQFEIVVVLKRILDVIENGFGAEAVEDNQSWEGNPTLFI